jgi:hypothetical protein
VKDANNCEQSGSEIVGQPTAVVASDSHTDANCSSGTDGTIIVTFSGGTPPYMVNFNGGGFVAQTSPKEYTGLAAGTYSWVVKDANNCEQSGSEDIVSVPCALCTYTQGYYGNIGGMSCVDNDKFTTKELIAKALIPYGGTMTIGLPGYSVLVSNTPASIDAVIEVLPGGGASRILSAGNYPITNLPDSYLRKGNINNTLLAQTITLGLNIGINGELGDFALQGGTIATAATEGGCGSDIAKVRMCQDTIVVNEYQRFYIKPNVVDALTNKTVAGLFELANNTLGGTALPVGVTLSDIAYVVDKINNAFDGCRIFMGYDIPELICEPVSEPAEVLIAAAKTTDALAETKTQSLVFEAFPVPFKDVLTIKYKFDYTSNVKIEVFNSQGLMILSKSDADGYLNKEVTLNLNLNRGKEQVFVVKVTTDRESIVKKVMSSK